ncbi:MAG: amidohydrolase, partial [Gammaproteobacteria bacterium]|nr:amidohydrolase [Gammaproteobacteria bacterium]
TKNGYELLGQDGGIIRAGKLADLLVVNGNPAKDITILQDRSNLDVVMKGGEFVTCQLTPSKIRVQKAA